GQPASVAMIVATVGSVIATNAVAVAGILAVGVVVGARVCLGAVGVSVFGLGGVVIASDDEGENGEHWGPQWTLY
ncbi:MAG: hypothetical protein ACI8S6_000683, partial [Myxococcota bacterium]